MQVLKFGGTSVANAQNIDRVIEIIINALKKDKTIVVFSAIKGCTDSLINIGHLAKQEDNTYIQSIDELEQKHLLIIDELLPSNLNIEDNKEIKDECISLFKSLREICNGVYILKEISKYSLDHIMSFGELLSTKIIGAKLKSLNINNKWIDSRKLITTSKYNFKHTVLESITYNNIESYFRHQTDNLFIVPGFIASDIEERTVTLGRGGSDYSASIFAVGTKARVLEIWTDVNGMMTADPRIVKNAIQISNISYKEALELSHFGAKVIYPPTIQSVVQQGIPIYIKNTFMPDNTGTRVEQNPPEGKQKIKGISSSNKIALLSMEGSGMIGIPGYSSRLFETLAKNNINIILITQASSVHTMCIAIDQENAQKAKQAADETFAYEISLKKVEPLKIEEGFSIISLVGYNRIRYMLL